VSGLSRRQFLKAGALAAAALATPSFVARSGGGVARAAAAPLPSYGSFFDIYRKQLAFDKRVRGTHLINCWYQAHCAFDVYVRDGIVFREEQAADYPQLAPEYPDLNPRGCQKGSCFSQRMYEENRLLYPIRRAGERGGGRWQRVTWDEALDAIADSWLDVLAEEGASDRVIWDLGASINVGAANAGQARLAMLTHSISLDSNSSNGDGHRGAFETFGNIYMERSLEDYFRSDLILVWGCNPIVTSIPNAHFFLEAKYNGSELVVISPDYSPSAIKADLWVPLKPGTDAALALAICRRIVEEGHVDEAFAKEQTDLPLLVRTDTGKFLTSRDVFVLGSADEFVMVDAGGGLVPVPQPNLALNGLDPRLEVDQFVPLIDGGSVRVRSVFSLLRERLQAYTPEAVSGMCGTSPALINALADKIIASKALSNVSGSSMNKYFHGNLTERAMILIWALKGHIGKPGAGYSAFSFLANDGWEDYVSGLRMGERATFGAEIGSDLLWTLARGDTAERFFKKLGHDAFVDPGTVLPVWTSSHLFWQVHGGVIELAENADQWIPGLKEPIRKAVAHALDSGRLPLQPPADKEPRILFHYCSNPMRSVRGSQKLLDVLWPKLKTIVAIDFRLNSTSKHADYVLPAAGWYEVTDHKWVTPLVPFNHVTNAATEPLGESKPDFWIFTMLAKHIQERAKKRGLTTVTSHLGKTIRLDTLYDDMTMDGRFTENDTDKAAGAILEQSSNLSHVSWEEQKEKGYARYSGIGLSPLSIGNAGEMVPGEPFVPLTRHTQGKQPYPTQTRRIQFYLDFETYLTYDEHLPRYKEPPKMGGDYPLMMTGGHERWSIHGVWRDNKSMLRLNRGSPFMVVNSDDAKARGIADGDWVRAYNDVGDFYIRVKVAPGVRPGSTILYHAWENYQFPGGKWPRLVSPSAMNPVELSGSHPHLKVGMLEGQPGAFDRDTRIEIKRVERLEIDRMTGRA
jgi:DMSO reductase family type II enzyme molybdopterin subunit